VAQKTVDLGKYRDLDIKEVTMRSVNGDDMLDAASRCIPVDGQPIDGNIFNMMLRQQVIAQAIIGYSPIVGERVKMSGPCLDSLTWSSRTREFVAALFDHMNGVDADEREDFRKALASSTPGSQDGAQKG